MGWVKFQSVISKKVHEPWQTLPLLSIKKDHQSSNRFFISYHHELQNECLQDG